MDQHPKQIRGAAIALAAVALAACGGDATGPGGSGAMLAVQFRTEVAAAGATSLGGGGGSALTITGSNGSLRIDDLRLVVAEFKLKRAVDDVCDGLPDGPEDACEEFDAGPFFVDVPLEGGATVVVSQVVPADTYRRFDFEVEDLEDEPDDGVEATRIEAVLADIRAEFPEWPRKAAMLAEGAFVPADGGDPRPFRVFFESEIEVEREFQPPLVVSGDDAQRTVSMSLDPSLWFTRGDGTVMDLSELDGTLVEFEVEIEHGFTSVEFD